MGRGALLAVVVAAGLAAPAAAEAGPCAELGQAAPFDVFVQSGYTAENTQLQGRLAAGGDVWVRGFGVGTSSALANDPDRVDLIAGRSLTASNAQAQHGSVTYGTTFTGSMGTVGNRPPERRDPPFVFADAFTALHATSERYAALAADGRVVPPPAGASWKELRLVGDSTTRNVFRVSASVLENANAIDIRVPAGSQTVINVLGSAYTTRTAPTNAVRFWDGSSYRQFDDQAPSPQIDALRRALLWNFPVATRVHLGEGLVIHGSVLAPAADITFPNGAKVVGQIVGRSLSGVATSWATAPSGTVTHSPYTGCLPTAATDDLELVALCRNDLTNRAKLRVTNTGSTAVTVTWTDSASAQTETLTLDPAASWYFGVADGDEPRTITVRSATETVTARTETRPCRGALVISKSVTGPGALPPAEITWPIAITGGSGFVATAEIAAGRTTTVTVPAEFAEAVVPGGTAPGGYDYTVTETDPKGAIATVSRDPVTILDGLREPVVIGNAYLASIDPDAPGPDEPGGETPEPTPTPLPEPGLPVAQPPQPSRLPGAPALAPGPDVRASTSQAAADLAVAVRITPPRTKVGRAASLVTTVRNAGPVPATDVVVREIPQRDPRRPNSVVRVLDVTGGGRCTETRPVRCELGTLAPGATVTIRGRGRLLVAGSLQDVVHVSTPTPESNTTNNVAADGIVASAPVRTLRVAVRAPRRAHVGTPIRYRVSVTAPGAGSSAVRLCHRPPRRMLVLGTGAARRVHGRLCLDIPRLRAGATRSFTVHAVAASRAADRLLLLPATADSPGRPRPATAVAPFRAVAQTPTGLG